MTEVAIPGDNVPVHSMAPSALIEWASAARAANQLATPLCQTEFVPTHFRGNPDAATAAILYGAEAGMSPLQALQGIFVIGGKPALYARAMMAITLSAGHAVWTEESTDSRAIVLAQRRGSQHVERVVVTMDQARKAGWTTNKKYTSEPAAMLLARAQSQACRRVAPDALAGMAHSAEELEDERPVEIVTVQREPRLTAQRKKKAESALVPEPDLEPEPPGEPRLTQEQSRKLHAQFGDLGYGSDDRAARLRLSSQIVGRELDSSSDLTKTEASALIDVLETALGSDDPQGHIAALVES